MNYEQILKDIKELKIQGAEKIAIAGVKAIELKLQITTDKIELEKYYNEIKNTRKTEPAMRNSVRFCLENYKKNPNVANEVIKYFKDSKQKIAEFGSKKIQDKMIIMTHCHSSTVEAIIIKAFKEGKKFKVYNTETRPKFQGRITAKELSKEGIEVHHFVDSAGSIAMREADLFLFGCDALTSEGKTINKIGTNCLLHFANKYNVNSYSCTNSWKFDPETLYGADEEIEIRDTKEVWANPPKNVIIHNPAFEPVSPDMTSGIISELGVLKPETMISMIKEKYPWMIKP